MTALTIVLVLALATCVVCWVGSLITKENSWVDRSWSLVPVVYVWVFAISVFPDPRLLVMALLVTLWGARLTFNFARKGGYSGAEDYRWAVLRGRMSRAQFAVFNVLFIVLFQNAVILLMTLPAYTATQHTATPFGLLDLLVTVLFLAFLAGETIADQQQWNFHRWKLSERAVGRTPDPAFLTTGLWRYSRHPNYFFELAQWWTFFVFGAIAAGSLLQWTVVGAVLLTCIFIGSTRFTESISAAKYPAYSDYQKSVSPVVPWFAPGARDRATQK